MSQFKVVVERHADGFVAYPLGLKDIIVGQGDTYDEAMTDVQSALRFHIDTFGADVIESDSTVLEAFLDEAQVDT